jgi:hypothetical protein
MMIYILILTVKMSYGAALNNVEFSSLEACQQAGAAIDKKWETGFGSRQTIWVCVKK